MIVKEVTGNILESPCQALVVPVNTVGAMGKGLALDFRNKFDGLYETYQKACSSGIFKRKGVFVYNHVGSGKKIVCLPTKMHWKYPSELRWIARALEFLAEDYPEYGIESLAIPALGTGLGGLPWDAVRDVIHVNMHPIDLPVTIYLPY